MVFLLLAETAAYLSVTTSTKVPTASHWVAWLVLDGALCSRSSSIGQITLSKCISTSTLHCPPLLPSAPLLSPPLLSPLPTPPRTPDGTTDISLPPSCALPSQYRFLATLAPCEHCTPDRTGLAPCPGCRLLIEVSGWRARSPIPSVCGIRPGDATRSAFASGWAVPVWPAHHPRVGRRGRPRVSCEYASLDVHDVLGHHRVNVTKNVGKYSVDSDLKWTGRVVRAAGRLSFQTAAYRLQ
jgi:hypothetical protein